MREIAALATGSNGFKGREHQSTPSCGAAGRPGTQGSNGPNYIGLGRSRGLRHIVENSHSSRAARRLVRAGSSRSSAGATTSAPIICRIDILHAVRLMTTNAFFRASLGEPCCAWPDWPRVEEVLHAIDIIEALGGLIRRTSRQSTLGQSVCWTSAPISIDGIEIGTALAYDRRGRALPDWQGCRAITPGEVFLMNSDAPASFDGRYFGPTPLSEIVGHAEPLWTFNPQ